MKHMKPEEKDTPTPASGGKAKAAPAKPTAPQKEVGGQKGPEPTRYGDWEKNGIISDF